jgi:hypothetical protein
VYTKLSPWHLLVNGIFFLLLLHVFVVVLSVRPIAVLPSEPPRSPLAAAATTTAEFSADPVEVGAAAAAAAAEAVGGTREHDLPAAALAAPLQRYFLFYLDRFLFLLYFIYILVRL